MTHPKHEIARPDLAELDDDAQVARLVGGRVARVRRPVAELKAHGILRQTVRQVDRVAVSIQAEGSLRVSLVQRAVRREDDLGGEGGLPQAEQLVVLAVGRLDPRHLHVLRLRADAAALCRLVLVKLPIGWHPVRLIFRRLAARDLGLRLELELRVVQVLNQQSVGLGRRPHREDEGGRFRDRQRRRCLDGKARFWQEVSSLLRTLTDRVRLIHALPLQRLHEREPARVWSGVEAWLHLPPAAATPTPLASGGRRGTSSSVAHCAGSASIATVLGRVEGRTGRTHRRGRFRGRSRAKRSWTETEEIFGKLRATWPNGRVAGTGVRRRVKSETKLGC